MKERSEYFTQNYNRGSRDGPSNTNTCVTTETKNSLNILSQIKCVTAIPTLCVIVYAGIAVTLCNQFVIGQALSRPRCLSEFHFPV